ncbi:MAG: bifunctional glycosyltransferase family 2/GtrA family protein [Acetatifactor sp.]|nr:bifunctional glycosyltransferase family 2/GtrA family protein [Acetatifactor sp.]
MPEIEIWPEINVEEKMVDRLNARIPLIIPAYEPDDRMLNLMDELSKKYDDVVVVLNDGSSCEFDDYYEIAKKHHFLVLKHYRNMGKGRALKDAFNYCLNEFPEMVGCVTADCDGQHSVEDILRCRKNLLENPEQLTLGCRCFDDKDIPRKSVFGNKMTKLVCRFLTGLNISDTQTGLRGIPKMFMADLLNTAGERFEFETRMLTESKSRYPISEISIQTIYDSKEQHYTHFDPIKDSIRIYKVFGRIFIRFVFSSLSSSIIDLLLFSCFVGLLSEQVKWYVAVATIAARILSATFNYLINYAVVFKSKEKHSRTTVKYFILAGCQMLCSAGFVTFGCMLLFFLPEIVVKIIVDTLLFLISYQIQSERIF